MNASTTALLIPCYNAERYLDNLRRQVDAVDPKFDEVLLLDDASTDETISKARELTNALVRLSEDPAMRSAMAQRARRRVLHAYTDDVIGPLYEQTYAEAIEMRGKRREATGKRS